MPSDRSSAFSALDVHSPNGCVKVAVADKANSAGQLRRMATMAKKEQQQYPIRATFSRDPYTRVFNSQQELAQWKADEGQFWTAVAANVTDAFSPPVRNNIGLLAPIAPDAQPAALQMAFEAIRDKYFCSEAGLGKLLVQISQPDVKRLVAAEVMSPGLVQAVNNPINTEARALATLYRAWGNADAGRTLLEDSVKAVASAQDANHQALGKISEFLEAVQVEWKTKIEGYEAKAALKAPKDYWTSRASKHEGQARIARLSWSRWMIICAALLALLALLMFTPIGDALLAYFEMLLGVPLLTKGTQSGDILELGGVLKRIVILGSASAFAVWWLRQKLRDLRSHEHLAEDAAERVTMVETYAAMRGAGLESGDLSLVLAALYRPASTGLIEDSGPVMPLEILMKGAGEALNKTGKGG